MISKTNSSKKIAVLYDCPYPFVQGGAQKRLFEIARRLVERGCQVDWYALKFWEGPDEIKVAGIHYKAIGRALPLYKDNGKRSLKEALYYGLYQYRNYSLAKYDIVHAGQFPYFHLYFAKLYSLLGTTKLVIDWWEVWGKAWFTYSKKAGLLGRCLEWLSSRLSHNIIAISHQGKQDLINLGIHSNFIQVIHNGVNFDEIQEIEADSNACDLIYMGRLASHKNVDHLIHATALLAQQGLTLKVEIIGDGPEYSNLVELTKNLALDNHIKFHGSIPQQNKAFSKLKKAKLFIHPSTKEGGGSIVALEANACGLPVIAYKHQNGLAKELIQEGVNGYWVDQVAPEALAKKILAVMHSRPLPTEKILSYAKNFDWQNIANQYFNYFQMVN